jgi:hypothetical protein
MFLAAPQIWSKVLEGFVAELTCSAQFAAKSQVNPPNVGRRIMAGEK